jgi:S-(hydroxymethyl)glutathione dehydrogenase/alcohol dehydrogenase
MRTRGAVIKATPGHYEVVDLELDDPRQDELLVRLVASGLCHSDDHIATGDFHAGTYPMCGGHEGAGIVEQVGPNTAGWKAGDHVVFSFLPVCGRCRWCSSGMQSICDTSEFALIGSRFDDPGSYRVHLPDGTDVGQMCGVGTFAEHTVVSTNSAIKVDPDLPLKDLCLFGCAIGTGWGSAVNSAGAQPGHTVVVMGVGGVGINAVQGAAHAGASHVIAVDPVAFKRDTALALGATAAFADMEEATEHAREVTKGQGADSAVVTVGVTTGEDIAQAFSAVRKAGTVVVTGVGPVDRPGIPISAVELTAYQKKLVGSHFGSCNPTIDIPRLIELYRNDQLKVKELITRTYTLDDIRKGYEDMHAGINIRGVIEF